MQIGGRNTEKNQLNASMRSGAGTMNVKQPTWPYFNRMRFLDSTVADSSATDSMLASTDPDSYFHGEGSHELLSVGIVLANSQFFGTW